MTGNPQLIAKIRAQIAAHGPMTFRDFMAAALYDPEHGFYTSGRAQIGRRGDFFTNVSVGPLFGQLLARQFAEMWSRLGKPAEFRLVEQGANTGDFCADVWRAAAPDFRAALRYTIIEPAPRLRARQQETLAGFLDQMTWCDSLTQLTPFCGVHFSNELLDALPVHLIRFHDGEWHERGVDENLALIDLPHCGAELSERIKTLPLPPLENYETEVNLAARTWIREVAAKLTRGYVLTIDYGYPRDIFYAPERHHGTLTCYAQQRRSFDPLQEIGESDLTAHVDFTSLAEDAIAAGCALAGFTDQHHFLVPLARDLFAENPPSAKEARALQTLIHPQFLGTTFKVLALQKDAPANLTGFEFATDPAAALGLGAPL